MILKEDSIFTVLFNLDTVKLALQKLAIPESISLAKMAYNASSGAYQRQRTLAP